MRGEGQGSGDGTRGRRETFGAALSNCEDCTKPLILSHGREYISYVEFKISFTSSNDWIFRQTPRISDRHGLGRMKVQ